MGIFDALTTAVAGLQAQSFALQNISGNVANSQTTGYKEKNTSFADLVSQAVPSQQTTDGVVASSRGTNTVQGSIQSTSVSTDMAINGDGFFVVAKPTGFTDNQPVFDGVSDYTRAGDFELNANGNLVNGAGYYLMGIPVDAATGNPVGNVPQVLQFNNNFVPAQATTQIQYQLNLPSKPPAMLDQTGFQSNPVAGAQIIGTGATFLPDAVANGTGTVAGLTSSTLLTNTDVYSVNDGTNTTSFTAGPTSTVADLLNAINSGPANVQATLSGLQRPSLDALTPRLVERDELMAAGALTSFRMTLGGIAGPALGGVLLATVGLATTYAVDMATFIVSLAALRMMRAVPPPPEAEPPSLRRIAEGLRYAGSRQELMGTYIVDIVAMFFGMPMALFPAFAKEFGGAGVLGLMYAAPAVGALIATVTSGWTGSVQRHGVAICVAAAGWGSAVLLTGLAPGLGLVLLGLALAGGADTISGIFRSTVWNQTIPDELRGRLAGIEQVSYSTGPLLGNVESGVAAALIGVRGAIVSGGALCVLGVAIVGFGLPKFWRYDSEPEPEPSAA